MRHLCEPAVLTAIAVALGLIGLTLWVRDYRVSRTIVRRSFRSGLAIGLVALAAGTGVVAQVTTCPTGKFGACPTGVATGTGYTCTNEYEQCGFAGLGNCLTVAGTMWWDSACECKCIGTGN